MSNQIPGVIHGRVIELENDPVLIEGQSVGVSVEPVPLDTKINPKTNRPWGEGILASAGAFADDPDADRHFEEIMQLRKLESRREIPD